jgi:hypothetical protein
MKRLLSIGLATAAAFLAVGCTSTPSSVPTSTAATTPSIRASATTQPTAAPTMTPALGNALTSWCALKLLEQKPLVLDAMAATGAQQTHDYDAIGASLLASVGLKNYSFEVWYASQSTLFATFNQNGKTVNLQAYVKGSLTTGSTQLACGAFRS